MLYGITYMWNIKQYNKLVDKTKKKQTNCYREQTSGTNEERESQSGGGGEGGGQGKQHTGMG